MCFWSERKQNESGLSGRLQAACCEGIAISRLAVLNGSLRRPATQRQVCSFETLLLFCEFGRQVRTQPGVVLFDQLLDAALICPP